MFDTRNVNESLLDTVPALLWTASNDGEIDYVNARWSEYTGLPIEAGLGWAWMDVVHPEDVEHVRDVWESALARLGSLEVQLRFRRKDGVYRWHVARAVPTLQADGRYRWVGSTFDVERQKRIERMLELLANAQDVFAASLDLRVTLERVCDLPVPEIADWSAVYLNAETPAEPASASGLDRSILDDTSARFRKVLESGTPLLERKLAIFPMIAERELIGAFGFGIDRSARSFTSSDVQFGSLLAQRAATAIVNAVMYEREREAAHVLQHALLPAALPQIEGLRLEACYVAAEASHKVGGDWYDAFLLDERRLLVSIGDVAGTSLTAAATMGRVRDALRTAALCVDDPAAVLGVADDVLRDAPTFVFVTCFVAILDLETREFRYANAGHYPPRLRSLDGTSRELSERGIPLGMRWASHELRPSGRAVLERGSMLVMFTDGLIEQSRDVFAGLDRLDRVLAELPEEGSARVLRDAFIVPPSSDDVAILTILAR